MRQHNVTILLIFFSLLFCVQPSYSAIKGGIKYSIPTDYTHLSEQELSEKADRYYFLAKNLKDKELNDDMTNALMLYSVLQNMNPENITYSLRLGTLYDKLGMDRYAKGNYSRAIVTKPNLSEPYFYMGEFYYKRTQYKNALKYYKKAIEFSKHPSYELLYRLGDIYEKFGDTKASLNYLRQAEIIRPNTDLENKINRVELFDRDNGKYYSR